MKERYNIIPCFLCGRSFQYTGPKGDESGRFCNPVCRRAYDLGYPTYEVKQEKAKRLDQIKDKKYYVVAGPSDIEIGSEFNFLPRKKLTDQEQEKNRVADKLQEFINSLGVSRNKLKYSKEMKKNIIPGQRGTVILDKDSWEVEAQGESKRHWTGIKKQLAFMDLVLDSDENSGKFTLDRLPTLEEAKILRKVIKFRVGPNTEKPSLETISFNQGNIYL